MSHEGLVASKVRFIFISSSLVFLLSIILPFFDLLSCPSFLTFKDLGISSKIETKNLFLFSYSESKKAWNRVHFDIENVDSLSQINMDSINNPESAPIFDDNLRVVIEFDQNIDMDRFSTNILSEKKDQFACKDYSFIYELYSPQHHSYLYLSDCKDPIPPSEQTDSVFNDTSKDLVYSTFFKYFHYPKNHVAFKEISVISQDKTRFISAANNARLSIFLDIKYFLSLELGASTLYSQVKSWGKTPIQNIADLIFFWKLLFMDIDIKMSATSSFYKESVYIPFKMNVPVEAKDYLNKTSGSLYSWATNNIISYDSSGSSIPIFKIENIKKPHIKDIEQKFCNQKTCKFSLNGSGPDFNFSAYFAMNRSMVDLGFFPYFVTDEAAARSELGWDSKINSSLGKRVGIYLNISGLKAGDYSWDFWIDVDKNKNTKKISLVCPSPIRVSPVFISR